MAKRFLLAATAALSLAAVPAGGQENAPINDQLAFGQDRAARMTVPVRINGRGPFNFVVDTGAERTVISSELARRLSLGEGISARMHSMSEVADVDTVVIPRLNVSKKTVRGINAPALAQSDLGADGLLGVDSLQSQRVLFDFGKQSMTISPSRNGNLAKMDGDTIVVSARSKYGRLILADAEVDGQKIWVVIDTGSQVSIGNDALRRKLAARKKLGPTVPVELISVTGGRLLADYTQIKRLTLGRVELTDMPIAFADAHPFRKLDLVDRPALLLGMDALALFDRVSVDFANRSIQFDMPDLSGRAVETRLALLEPAGRTAGE